MTSRQPNSYRCLQACHSFHLQEMQEMTAGAQDRQEREDCVESRLRAQVEGLWCPDPSSPLASLTTTVLPYKATQQAPPGLSSSLD